AVEEFGAFLLNRQEIGLLIVGAVVDREEQVRIVVTHALASAIQEPDAARELPDEAEVLTFGHRPEHRTRLVAPRNAQLVNRDRIIYARHPSRCVHRRHDLRPPQSLDLARTFTCADGNVRTGAVRARVQGSSNASTSAV